MGLLEIINNNDTVDVCFEGKILFNIATREDAERELRSQMSI